MRIEKRVDLRMQSGFRVKGKRVVRGKAYVNDDGSVAIEYLSQKYPSYDDLLTALPNLRAVVTGDKELRDILDKNGFNTEDVDKKKASLHVTIDTHLLDLVEDEASERGVYTSKVITDILNAHYGTKYQ